MSIAGELGGLLGRMAGAAFDPVFWLAFVCMVQATRRRWWVLLVVIPASTVAIVAAINREFWRRAGVEIYEPVIGLLTAYYAWAVLIFVVAFVWRRFARPSLADHLP